MVSVPPCLPQPSSDVVERENNIEESQGLLATSLDQTAALPAALGQSEFDIISESRHAVQHSTSKPSGQMN